jgi:thiol reductant ABC exporter, CydD subunit
MPDSPESPGGPRSAEAWLRGEARASAKAELQRAMILSALGAALVVPQAWLLAHALALVVMEGAPIADALPWLAPVPVLLILRFLLVHAGDRAALGAGARLKVHVRDALLSRLLAPRRPAVATGEAVSAVVEGVDALEPYVTRYLAHLGILAAVPLVILAVVLPRDWISGLVLACTAPAIPIFMILIGNGAARLSRRQWQETVRLSGKLLDGLQRLGLLRALNAGPQEERRLAAAAEAYRRSTMAVLRVAFLSSLALEFFATVGVAVVAVLIGFRLLAGEMAFEVGFFVLLLAPEFYAPLRQLGADHHARMEALAAAERLIALAGPPPAEAGSARPDFGKQIGLACEEIEFAYEPGVPIISGVSLYVAPGMITALAGPSGAGKSTLLALLLGQLRPRAGRVLVDGHDLAEIDPEYWLAQVALVPQRPYMFAGSVLDNIRLADPAASPERVRAAARKAQAEAFIEALPQGYDTPLGEHGATLSGGQVQRIALARAFLKERARLLVMDEGAAGLDRETEAALGTAIRELARDRTTLLIAHRPATLALADHCFFLDHGRLSADVPEAQADMARRIAEAGGRS